MPVADLLILGCLAGVLCLSGLAKLRAREETEDAFVSLRVPAVVPRRAGAAALPWVELLLALALLVGRGSFLVVVATASTVLMATYTVLIARALTFDDPVTCSCFGRLGGHRIDRSTLARNLLLTGLAVWALVVGVRSGSFAGAVDALDANGWWAVIASVAVAAIGVLIAAGGRDELEVYGEEQLDYLRAPIPFARLELPDGRTATLRDLAETQARLLVLLNLHCGACQRIATLVDDWAARLAPAVDLMAVYSSHLDPAVDLAHDRGLVALDPDDNVHMVLGIRATPAAVLLGADGLLAGGPVFSKDAVVQFVDEVLLELEAADAPSDS